jgi:hypothetical protein
MNRENIEDYLELQTVIWQLQRQLHQLQNKTRVRLFWQTGIQILLGAVFEVGAGLEFWTRAVGYLLFLLGVILWLFSNHDQILWRPNDLYHGQELETQAAILDQKLNLGREIYSWERRSTWIQFWGWMGFLLQVSTIISSL